MTGSRDITFVLTSCGRFDLLAETLLTFLEHNTAPIARWLIVEDSGQAGVRDVLGGIDAPLEFLVNDPPVGQIASIDRAYALVDTPYVFHCEDDWRFFRAGFVEESRLVLDRRGDVSTVVVRRTGQNPNHDAALTEAPVERVGHVAFRRSAAGDESPWGGYSFNPGLRRIADVRELGSFAALGNERHASAWFKRRGMRLAALEVPACETTGLMRHVSAGSAEQIVMLRRAPAPAASAGASQASRVAPSSGAGRAPSSGARPAPTSRNDPCPCGSGMRFKHCHGARS